MTKHPRNVEGFKGSLKELASSIGNMTYDKVAEIIGELADDLKRQADGDFEKGRKQLASKVYSAAEKIGDAKKEMEGAWKICEPYMKN